MKKIVCFGPGPKFKGGISNYNTSLAKALDRRGDCEVHIVSWTNQYPAIIPREFVDKSSKTDLLEGTNIAVKYITNYNNPLSWNATAKYIADLKPDIVVFQWAIAIQGIPLGFIAKKLKKHKDIEVLFDLHFVGKREGEKTVIKLYHPIYDLFQPDPTFNIDEFKKEHGLAKNVLLFFGFIRKYKGLHFAIKAFAKVAEKRDDVSLLICGESFWNTVDKTKLKNKIKSFLFGLAKGAFLKKKDDEGDYRPLELIKEYGLEDRTMVVNKFVPNEELPGYFQVSDAVVLFYEYATPSGIESLSYNFKKPLLATKVGHFPETIEDGFNGLLAEAEDIEDMARIMEKFIDNPLNPDNVEEKTKDMSWDNYASAILNK